MSTPTTVSGSGRTNDTRLRRGTGLEYEEHGDGDAVLFIHGAIVADLFAPVIRHPALHGYRCIRYRRRGYGGSDPFTSEPTIERHAADARALLGALGVSRTHVVAHSGGGPVAVQLAVDAPEVVRSLVLLEPAVFTAATAAAFGELTAPIVEMSRTEPAKAVHLWMRSVGGRDWRAAVEAHVPGAAARAEADATATFDGDVPAILRWNADAVRSQLVGPLLHVAGSESAATAEPAAALLRETVADLHEVVVDHANHMSLVLHPSTPTAIDAFLGRQR